MISSNQYSVMSHSDHFVYSNQLSGHWLLLTDD